ncbi:MAG TPA: hypothetical protein VLB73_04210 [Patescibacteria group bacterium]|nr:hypothetical protein [Patescibacteria group bacterium]
MLLAVVIVFIAIVSVGISYWSLRNELKKHKHVEEVKKDLAKGKVIFYAPSDASSK